MICSAWIIFPPTESEDEGATAKRAGGVVPHTYPHTRTTFGVAQAGNRAHIGMERAPTEPHLVTSSVFFRRAN
jgi:hypothetical protein